MMKDVFGTALYSYWKGDNHTPLLICRDDNYRVEENLESFFARQIQPLEALVASYAKGKILDLGCGAGPHVLYYQGLGLDIVGIDRSALAVKVCQERGCHDVAMMDAFDLSFPPQCFDTMLLFGNYLGIGGDLQGAERLLLSLGKHIKPNGHLLLTALDVTKTQEAKHQKYHKKNRSAGRYVGEIKIRLVYKNQISDWFQWVHVGPKMLKKLAIETGWKIAALYETDGGDYAAMLNPS